MIDVVCSGPTSWRPNGAPVVSMNGSIEPLASRGIISRLYVMTEERAPHVLRHALHLACTGYATELVMPQRVAVHARERGVQVPPVHDYDSFPDRRFVDAEGVCRTTGIASIYAAIHLLKPSRVNVWGMTFYAGRPHERYAAGVRGAAPNNVAAVAARMRESIVQLRTLGTELWFEHGE